jgi:hypothetical protein
MPVVRGNNTRWMKGEPSIKHVVNCFEKDIVCLRKTVITTNHRLGTAVTTLHLFAPLSVLTQGIK